MSHKGIKINKINNSLIRIMNMLLHSINVYSFTAELSHAQCIIPKHILPAAIRQIIEVGREIGIQDVEVS